MYLLFNNLGKESIIGRIGVEAHILRPIGNGHINGVQEKSVVEICRDHKDAL